MRSKRSKRATSLANLRWDEIDVTPVVERLAAIAQEIESIQASNASLAQLEQMIESERGRLEDAQKALQNMELDLRDAERQQRDAQSDLEKIDRTLAQSTLTVEQREGLASRFETLERNITLKNLVEMSNRV